VTLLFELVHQNELIFFLVMTRRVLEDPYSSSDVIALKTR